MSGIASSLDLSFSQQSTKKLLQQLKIDEGQLASDLRNAEAEVQVTRGLLVVTQLVVKFSETKGRNMYIDQGWGDELRKYLSGKYIWSGILQATYLVAFPKLQAALEGMEYTSALPGLISESSRGHLTHVRFSDKVDR